MFQFAFGCHNRQVSRVFTINERTCRVCFQYVEEFEYPGHQYIQNSRALPNGNAPRLPCIKLKSSCFCEDAILLPFATPALIAGRTVNRLMGRHRDRSIAG
jgi:hypothetical protein